MPGKFDSHQSSKANAIKLGVAGGCLLCAGAMTAFSLGLFDAAPPSAAPDAAPADGSAGNQNQQVAAPNQQSVPGSGSSRGSGWRTSSGQLERRD